MTSPTGSGSETSRSPRLKAIVEPGSCCGYGVCSEMCPQVFARGEDGLVSIAVEFVPAELEAQAREAAASCPQAALSIVAA
jgi:ferredoxin